MFLVCGLCTDRGNNINRTYTPSEPDAFQTQKVPGEGAVFNANPFSFCFEHLPDPMPSLRIAYLHIIPPTSPRKKESAKETWQNKTKPLTVQETASLNRNQTKPNPPSSLHNYHLLRTTHPPKTCNPTTATITPAHPFALLPSTPASTTSAVPHLAFATVGRLSPSATNVVQNPPCCRTVVVGL